MSIYDATGSVVKDFLLPTAYSLLPTVVSWDGTDNRGRKLASAVYFVEVKIGKERLVKPVLLIR